MNTVKRTLILLLALMAGAFAALWWFNDGAGGIIPQDLSRIARAQTTSGGNRVSSYLPKAAIGAMTIPGVWVAYVEGTSSAQEAGLRRGNFITRVNKIAVDDDRVISRLVDEAPPGTVFTLYYIRLDPLSPGSNTGGYGSIVTRAPPSVTNDVALPDNANQVSSNVGFVGVFGAWVDYAVPDSPAARGGLRHGDVIYRIDGTPVSHGSTLNYVLDSAPLGHVFTLHYLRLDTFSGEWAPQATPVTTESLTKLLPGATP